MNKQIHNENTIARASSNKTSKKQNKKKTKNRDR